MKNEGKRQFCDVTNVITSPAVLRPGWVQEIIIRMSRIRTALYRNIKNPEITRQACYCAQTTALQENQDKKYRVERLVK